MAENFKSIANYWRSAYSSKIKDSEKLELPKHFKRMAGLMAPGRSYYYIANFHTLELEFISDTVENFTGLPPEEVDMDVLLSIAAENEIESIRNKEKVIQAFFIDFLDPGEVMDYKVMYTYRLKDHEGREKIMLHQASVLSTTGEGRFVHVFSCHTDISHLAISSTDHVSFIHVDGGKDYLNVCSKDGTFDPEQLVPEQNFEAKFSGREIEIVQKMAAGLNSEEVARELYISPNTVRTHRKNILKKTDCKNSMQLIAKCIATGIIPPTA